MNNRRSRGTIKPSSPLYKQEEITLATLVYFRIIYRRLKLVHV